MGVPGLWARLHQAGEPVNLHALGLQGLLAPHTRGQRLGVDVSLWFFHVAAMEDIEQYGANGGLRTLYFRVLNYLRQGFLLYFVFDGPHRPSLKRGKYVRGGRETALARHFRELLGILGIDSRTAPGEAEYELVAMNQAGLIDIILTVRTPFTCPLEVSD